MKGGELGGGLGAEALLDLNVEVVTGEAELVEEVAEFHFLAGDSPGPVVDDPAGHGDEI